MADTNIVLPKELEIALEIPEGGIIDYEPFHSVTGLTNLIFRLKNAGCEPKEAAAILEAVYQKYIWLDSDEKASMKGLFAVYDYLREVYSTGARPVSVRIWEYLNTALGWFSVADCDKECRIVTKQEKDSRRQIFYRLVKDGTLEKHLSKNGYFRKRETEAETIAWVDADVSNIYPVKLPFGLEKYVKLYPKNIGVIAAPPNAGKTAYLLNLIRLNMEHLKVHYFCSEMGAEELKVRLAAFEDVAENEWIFDPRERSANFADVIYPDDLNIIDYIEMPEGNFYMVASEIRAIFDKLRNGIAFIAIQKKQGATYGRGGELSAEKARLYLDMENNTLTIRKGKVWAQKGVNPNGKQFPFQLVGGAKFIIGQEGYEK